ncbi:PucR family transcriptional regulator [Brevibacterium zhoupengii]|uniref:PucR family transcriptional regulator n=1 Tax=Brevibacterium zhoupengii TaxID=2898795 RepID=UPI001F09042C|nr:helix-turn-helix domain-containing protein [Brevibacterium zhoupengii]
MIKGASLRHNGVGLHAVITAMDSAVCSVIGIADETEPEVSTVMIVDSTELDLLPDGTTSADLIFLIGAEERALFEWLERLKRESEYGRPIAFVVKETSDSPRLRAALESTSMSMIVIDAAARWAAMHLLVEESIHRHRSRVSSTHETDFSSRFNDLFQLSELVAQHTGGMVSIEDADESRVLAYSPSNEAADEMRIRTILGRKPDSEALQVYRRNGVMSAIRSGADVVAAPAYEEEGLQPRLAAGIHSPNGLYLGSMWVQRGPGEFLPDSEAVVRGAAATAAQILLQETQVPSMMELNARRLFAQHDYSDSKSVSEQLGIDSDCVAAVVGLSPERDHEAAFLSSARLVLLHARAFSAKAVVAMLDGRGYILLPNYSVAWKLQQWVEQLVTRFTILPGKLGCSLRAAIAAPVNGLASVASARAEIDQVLDGPIEFLPRVTTLEQSRTTVLLDQVRASLRSRPDLRDPRIAAVAAYDHDHGTGLIDSLREYFSTGGNVRRSAGRMQVHPNTLHYRLERAQTIAGLNFDNAKDRLLTALQVTVFDFENDSR